MATEAQIECYYTFSDFVWLIKMVTSEFGTSTDGALKNKWIPPLGVEAVIVGGNLWPAFLKF